MKIIIGNKADSATPFVDASRVARRLDNGADVIEQDGFSHISLAQPSNFTANIIKDCSTNNIRPTGDDTVLPAFPPTRGVGASDISFGR